jgi:cytidine deaminase
MLTKEQAHNLVQIAQNSRQWAYAPYSNYPVGAALLTASGRIYEGVNVENAAYPTSMCAERVALFKAVSEGEHQFEAIVVVSTNGASPCGACRQALAEFGVDTIVIIADEIGKILHNTTIQELLPLAFGPKNLEVSAEEVQ